MSFYNHKKSPTNRLRDFAIYLTAGSVLLSACSKKFTNSNDTLLGQPAATQFWNTASDAASAVNSIYGNLRSYANTAFPAIAIESMGADDVIKGSVASDATFMNEYDQFTIDPSESQLGGFWQGQYQNINFANQVLDHIDTMASVPANLKTRYDGEAKFLRALSYFRLERAFGNIPLLLHVPLTAAQQNIAQSTPTQVWAAIEQDLTDAASALPISYDAADVGRATQGAALALHAKVSLYLKNWSDAVNYSGQVMALGVYSLYPDYYGMFRYAGENCSESVFEVQCDYVPNNDDINSSQYSQVEGDRDVNPSVGWGFNVPTQDLVNEFEPGDYRLTSTVMIQGTTTPSGDAVPMASAGAPTMYNMKSYVPFVTAALSPNQGCAQNYRMIRYADVLLINAEANNEAGNSADALTALEMVRARARAQSTNPATDLPPVTTTDQGTIRTAIYHERRVELAMEFDRYFDVIRQGRASTVFGPLGWTSKNTYWPIPQTEIDLSGDKLVQNPGY
jgi:starch-binding outer membrane protein, SusD/RagB family